MQHSSPATACCRASTILILALLLALAFPASAARQGLRRSEIGEGGSGRGALGLDRSNGGLLALPLSRLHDYPQDCGQRLHPGHLALAAQWAHAGNQAEPGAGMRPEAITPFEFVLKSGFLKTACVKDELLEVGDKFGKNKDSYALGGVTNVSIVRYTSFVPKEDRKPMSIKVCFDFCRTVPDMDFFGLTRGRECYCAPFFKSMASDSSQCDLVCEGDATQVCGGASKSSIFEMHDCGKGNTLRVISKAMSAAAVQWQELSSASKAVTGLMNSMALQAATLQVALAQQGDSAATELVKTAKEYAGALVTGANEGQEVLQKIQAQVVAAQQLAQALKAAQTGQAGPSDGRISADLEQQADDNEAKLSDLMIKAKSSAMKLQVLARMVSPSYGDSFRGAGKQYLPIMYFVDKAVAGAPTTCGGENSQGPIVGKSFEECAMACDAEGPNCMGFSYFPSKLCFLFVKILQVTYYTGCGPDNSATPDYMGRVGCAVKLSALSGATLKPDPSGKCRQCLKSATKAARCPQFQVSGVIYGQTRLLSAEAFTTGTYVVSDPGTYVLTEDVVFEPRSSADSMYPHPLSLDYPQTGGYFLGFFAAVSITADDVIFDCRGHTIRMSGKFHKHQRVFSIFELGSKPFFSQDGTPAFPNPLLTPGLQRSAKSVKIMNCKIGLSSQYGIHGSDNQGVTLQNLEISNFEVGGIYLSGASKVLMEDVDVGPAASKAYDAQLGQAILLDRLVNTLLKSIPPLSDKLNEVTLTIRGEETNVEKVFTSLGTELREFLGSSGGPLAPLFGNGQAKPGGEVLFGIALLKKQTAVSDFGLGLPATPASDSEEDAILKNVTVHELTANPEQYEHLVYNSRKVVGPFHIFRIVAAKSNEGVYAGNTVSDAQIALGALKQALLLEEGALSAEAAWYLGGMNIPAELMKWAEGDVWDARSFTRECFSGATGEANEGVIGIRLESVRGVVLEDVEVSMLENTGTNSADSTECSNEAAIGKAYKGKDVTGAMLINCPNANITGLRVDESSLVSIHNGEVTGVRTV